MSHTEKQLKNQHKLKTDFIENTFIKSEINKQLFLHLTHLGLPTHTPFGIFFNLMGLKKPTSIQRLHEGLEFNGNKVSDAHA